MSASRRAETDFIDDGDEDDDNDMDLTGQADYSDDEDEDDELVGSSTAPKSNRPQRDRRAPRRLEDQLEQDSVRGSRSGQNKKRGPAQGRDKGKGRAADAIKGRTWEGDIQRSWDIVQEDEQGTLEGAVTGALLSSKTRR